MRNIPIPDSCCSRFCYSVNRRPFGFVVIACQIVSVASFRYNCPCKLWAFTKKSRHSCRQFRILQSLAENPVHDSIESFGVCQFSFIESENLLIDVSEQMPRHDADICSLQSSLEQTPEVFHPVRVTTPINIRNGMINCFVNELGVQGFVGCQRIGIDRRTMIDVRFCGACAMLTFE